jgi:PAS domain S-box-containing protein
MKSPLRVLLVEDREEDAVLVLETLRRGGCEPEFERVQDAEAMREALCRKEWDLVLSDYEMPAFSGPEAIEILRETCPDIPLLVISGKIGEDVAVETLKKGAQDYLLKQNLTRLVPAIERAIREMAGLRKRHAAEKELRRAAQIFSQLQESVICTDREGRITYWNEASEALLGWKAEEVRGRPVCEFLSGDGPEQYASQVLEKGEFHTQIEHTHKDRGRMWLDVRVTPFADESGGRLGYVAVTRDITERILNRQALEKANVELQNALALEQELLRKAQAGEKAKTEFLAVMSHEIRTPMNGVLGFVELLADSPHLSSEDREHVAIIKESGEALLRILDDILDYSRIEAERVTVEISTFSPRALAESVWNLLLPSARAKGLAFDVHFDDRLPATMAGDEGRIRQILINLVGNAIKFTSSGSISLEGRPASVHGRAGIEFAVRDTGPGVDDDKLEDIFVPFFQSDSSTARAHGGTGLGLSICRRLAELMKGSISVKSREGQGTEFTCFLPLEAARSTPARPSGTGEAGAPARPLVDASHSLRVLIVEDDRTNLRLLQTLLRKLGFEASVATNGREAVEVYERVRPDCVVMDLQMPVMDGIEAARKIRKVEKKSGESVGSFIFALTANTVPADRQRCFDAGMNGYLNKPVKLNDLVSMLQRAHDVAKSL